MQISGGPSINAALSEETGLSGYDQAVQLIEIRSFSRENPPAPKAEINNCALVRDPADGASPFNLTLPCRILT